MAKIQARVIAVTPTGLRDQPDGPSRPFGTWQAADAYVSSLPVADFYELFVEIVFNDGEVYRASIPREDGPDGKRTIAKHITDYLEMMDNSSARRLLQTYQFGPAFKRHQRRRSIGQKR